MLRVAEGALEGLTKALACVALAGLIGIALFVLAEGLSRWLFAITFPGLQDVTHLSLPVVVAACFPAALRQRYHIRVRFVGSALGPPAERALDALGALLLLLCMALISYELFVYALDTARNREVTWTLQLPVAPTWFATASLMALAALAQALVAVRDWAPRHE